MAAARALGAEDVLRLAERSRSRAELSWCTGAVETANPNATVAYTEVAVLLRASSFPDVAVTKLTVGVAGWADDHLAVVTVGPPGEEGAVLHAGTPAAVTRDNITLWVARAPPVRGAAILTVQLRGGSCALAAPGPAGKLDDGGLVMVAAACGNGSNGSAPCSPALFRLEYDAECASPPKQYVLKDSVRVARLGASEAQLVVDQLVPELRAAYGLREGDVLTVTDRTFERWLGVSNRRGAMRVSYVVRSDTLRAAPGDEQLQAIAFKLGVSTVSRHSPSHAKRVIQLAAACALAATCTAAAAWTAGRARAPSPSKTSIEVTSTRGAYKKSLMI